MRITILILINVMLSFSSKAQLPKELKAFILQDFVSIITLNDSIEFKEVDVNMRFYSNKYTNFKGEHYLEFYKCMEDSMIVENDYISLVLTKNVDSIWVKKYRIHSQVNKHKKLIYNRLFILEENKNDYKMYDLLTKEEFNMSIVDLSKFIRVIEMKKDSNLIESYYYYYNNSNEIIAMLKQNEYLFNLIFSIKKNIYKVSVVGNEMKMHLNELDDSVNTKEYFLKHVNNHNFDVGECIFSIK